MSDPALDTVVLCGFCRAAALRLPGGADVRPTLAAHGWQHDASGIYCGGNCAALAAQHRAREPHDYSVTDQNDPRLREVEQARARSEKPPPASPVVLTCSNPQCGGAADRSVHPAQLTVPADLAARQRWLDTSGWIVGAHGRVYCSKRCTILGTGHGVDASGQPGLVEHVIAKAASPAPSPARMLAAHPDNARAKKAAR